MPKVYTENPKVKRRLAPHQRNSKGNQYTQKLQPKQPGDDIDDNHPAGSPSLLADFLSLGQLTDSLRGLGRGSRERPHSASLEPAWRGARDYQRAG